MDQEFGEIICRF